MSNYVVHLPILSIIIPLIAGGLMVLFKEKRRSLNTFISFASIFAQLFVAVNLLLYTSGFLESELTNNIAVYLLGNWQAPLGIVLVADQLAALMLCLSGFRFNLANLFDGLMESRRYSLLPIISIYFNGPKWRFLTGDLFNLFVFFEVF